MDTSRECRWIEDRRSLRVPQSLSTSCHLFTGSFNQIIFGEPSVAKQYLEAQNLVALLNHAPLALCQTWLGAVPGGQPESSHTVHWVNAFHIIDSRATYVIGLSDTASKIRTWGPVQERLTLAGNELCVLDGEWASGNVPRSGR